MSFRSAELREEKEFTMTAADFRFIRDLAYQQTGIVLPERKQHMVYSRLCRRLRALKLANFSQYCQYLANTPDEQGQFINALTTNLTAFFRESHHFNFLEQQLIPLWMQRKNKRIRIWSSACSTGEEPYSIAMTLAQTFAANHWDLKILATDLDTNVLQKACNGIYPIDVIDSIPVEFRAKHLMQSNAQFKIKDKIKELVHFKHLNLLGNWPMKGPFDVIFCRNVLIYFDNETKRKIISRFRRLLSEDGILIIGHSETLHKISNEFELIGQTVYIPK